MGGMRELESLGGLCEARPTAAGAYLSAAANFSTKAGLVSVSSSNMAFSRRLDDHVSGVDHMAIHVVTSGAMMWRQEDRPRLVGPGAVVLTDLASEFGCASGEGNAEWVILLLNRHQIGSELLAPLSDRPTILDERRPLVAALHALLGGFAEALRSGKTADDAVADDLNHFGEAATGILQVLLRGTESRAAPKPRQNQSKLLQICRRIDEDLASPELVPEALARRFGLSRASIYRMFEPLGGVARYIRLQKIARASAELQKGDSRSSLAAVAKASGFSSADAFVRAFREAYGTTPREFRHAQSMPANSAHTSLAGWLERNYFWKTNAPRPRAGAHVIQEDADRDYATAEATDE